MANKYRKAHPEWFDEKGRPTVEVLRALIDYNPETGEMRWKKRGVEWFDGEYAARSCKIWNTRYAGKSVGCVKTRPNRIVSDVSVLDVGYYGMQIAYAIVNGVWPGFAVAAADGNALNSTYSNIASLSKVMRRHRVVKSRKASSIYVGVYFDKVSKKWVATIFLNKKNVYLGCFKTEQDAADAYDRAAILHLGPDAYLNLAERPEVTKPEDPEPVEKPKQHASAKQTERDDF